MTVSQAVSQLLEIESLRKTGILAPETTLAIGVSRIGGVSDGLEETGETITAGTLAQLLAHPPASFGPPLHSVVILGKRLHHLEVEYTEAFAIDAEVWKGVAKDVYGVTP